MAFLSNVCYVDLLWVLELAVVGVPLALLQAACAFPGFPGWIALFLMLMRMLFLSLMVLDDFFLFP